MAPPVSKDLAAEIKKYYDAQESYTQLLHQAVQRETKDEHSDKPKRQCPDLQRKSLDQKTKPDSEHSWENHIDPEEIMKTFRDLSVKVSGESTWETKKGPKT